MKAGVKGSPTAKASDAFALACVATEGMVVEVAGAVESSDNKDGGEFGCIS